MFVTRFHEGGQEVVGRRVVLRTVLFDFISLMKPSFILTLVSLATAVGIVTSLQAGRPRNHGSISSR